MKLVLSLILLVVAGYVGTLWMRMIQAKDELGRRVVEQLNVVDENNQPEIRKRLVDEAAKLGIDLSPNTIFIGYEDSDARSIAQKLTSGIATFVNKRITIHVSYIARLAGIPVHQEIEETTVRQIQAQSRQSSELNKVLEGPSR